MILKKGENLTILIPEAASPRERFAAEELQKYLKMSIGVSSNITSKPDKTGKNSVIIGGPDRNSFAKSFMSQEEFYSEVPGAEGFLIKSLDENTLLIAGSTRHTGEVERGTVYGVYEFLERYVGCSLAAFSKPDEDIGEIVPVIDELKLDGIYYKKEGADRPYRTAIVQFADAATVDTCYDSELNIPFFDWLVKNRYNRILTWTSIYETFKKNGLLEEATRRGLKFTVGHHESSRLFLPAYGNEHFEEHYYETHPEYFKLLENGERFNNRDHWGQWVFCSRNENAIAEISKNIVAWLSKNPAVDIIAFWPNDGIAPQCLCPDCQKYTKTENYCYFVNEVAKRVKKHHPNVKFDLLIYTDLWECPEGMKLEDCILIDESTWHASGLRTVGKPDGTSLIGTFYQENMKNWRATGAQVVYYDYYMGVYGVRQRWIPMADELQSLWKSFIEEDFAGSGTQIECFNMWNHLFNFYSFARVGYDTSLSMEDCLLSFKKLFGDGGDRIAEVIRILEDVLDGQIDIMQCGHYLQEHVDHAKIYALFDEALALAKSGRERNNIRLLRMVFRYSDLETREKLSRREEYIQIVEDYDDETGELGRISEYSSFKSGRTGYGIAIPLKSKNEGKYMVFDKWYDFE